MKNNTKNKTYKIIKIFNLLAICAIIKCSNTFVLAKPLPQSTEVNKEILKKAKEFIENFFKDSKISEKEDEKLYEENLKIFKNFNKQDYEVEGFNLEIYKKRGVPILVYTHKVTKAVIVFIPIDNVDESLLLTKKNSDPGITPTDSYFFRATEQNNKGLIHIAEHCLWSSKTDNKLRKNFKNSALNARTSPFGFQIDYNSTFHEEELEKEILKILLKPDFFEDEKLFEIEKRRAIIEMTSGQNEFEKDEFSLNSSKKGFIAGGIPEQMKNVTLIDIKNVYEKYFHPSNILITKFINLNSTKIKGSTKIKSFLENLKVNYLNHFKNYKETNYNKNYFIKQKPFEKISVSYEPSIFENFGSKEKIKSKYFATIDLYDNYDLWDGKNPKILDFLSKYGIAYSLACDFKQNGKITEIEDFIKKLGYTSYFFKDFSSCLKLYGNNPELFTEEVLKENSKKIFNFIYSKLESYNLEEIKLNSYSFKSYNYSNENLPENKEKFGLKSDILRYENENLDSMLQRSFYFTSNPISNILFKLTKENEIKETTPDEVKNTIPKLNALIDDAKNPIIRVYEHVKINKPDKKHEEIYENNIRKTIYPIKITDYFNNYSLGMLATLFIIEKLDCENLVFKDAINYHNSINTSFFKDYISTAKTITKEISQDVVNYIFKIFDSFKEKLKITKEEFETLKSAVKEHVKNMLAVFEDGKRNLDAFLKAIKQYLEKGLDEKSDVFSKNKGFEITKRTTRNEIFNYYIMLIDENVYFESFEDRKNYFKNKKEFFKKYGKFVFSDNTPSLIDKEFIKDLNELLIKPNLKRVEFKINCLKNFIENYDSIKFEDFKKAVKSAELVKRTKYEEDQKQEDENIKIDMLHEII